MQNIKLVSSLALSLMLGSSGIPMCQASPTYTVGATALQNPQGWTVSVTGTISWGASDSTKNKAGSAPANTSATGDTCLAAAQGAINKETAIVTEILNTSNLTQDAQKALAAQEQTVIDGILKPCE